MFRREVLQLLAMLPIVRWPAVESEQNKLLRVMTTFVKTWVGKKFTYDFAKLWTKELEKHNKKPHTSNLKIVVNSEFIVTDVVILDMKATERGLISILLDAK